MREESRREERERRRERERWIDIEREFVCFRGEIERDNNKETHR